MEEMPPNTPSAHAVFPTTQTPDAPGLTMVPQRLTQDQDEGAGNLFGRLYQEAPVKSGETEAGGVRASDVCPDEEVTLVGS